MRAIPHISEKMRLEALGNFGIIDTEQEPEFDKINELSADICEAPICLISFVDENRQWFKSKIGLDINETPLEQSICAHAIVQNEYLEIHDTSLDERTADNPLCMGEKPVRFYAGAIMRTSQGLPLGTLCILDHKPRKLSTLQTKTLKTHASYIVKLLELRVAIKNEQLLRRTIDYRVKKSFQSVSEMVRLTRSNISSVNFESAFLKIERQLDAIELLHRELHIEHTIETVQLKNFLGGVLKLFQQSAPDNVRIIGSIADISVIPVEATAIAIIINEFIANSIEHAFPDSNTGMISIRCERLSDDHIRISCCDNGIGSSQSEKEYNLDPTGQLGAKLMDAAAAQIRAIIDQTCDKDGYVLATNFKSRLNSHDLLTPEICARDHSN